jgi:hypothetical protein
MSSDDLVNKMAGKVAVGVDRRGFFRRAARSTFITAALVSAGGIGEIVKGSPAFAFTQQCASMAGDNKGHGCPGGGTGVWNGRYPCGPSRCCSSTDGCASGCDCDAGSGGALCVGVTTPTTHCQGNAHTWSNTGRSCWTCNSPNFSCGNPGCQCYLMTTCCDCKTSGCSACTGDLGDHICISTYTVTLGPFC